MRILVTGGLGFIGSHTSLMLYEKGYEVIIMDNLSNSSMKTFEKLSRESDNGMEFVKGDILNEEVVDKLLSHWDIDGVIHFAALKSVEESMMDPLRYYLNNVVGTIKLLGKCRDHGIGNFVFSSSASVYGNAKSPVSEDAIAGEVKNPYGKSKAMCERILQDTAACDDSLKITILRYFNVSGAHPGGILGEESLKEAGNITSHIVKVATGEKDKLLVYGNDYDSPDGTGVRDYIHVMDVARGHVLALEKKRKGCHIYNLGTGRGTSVLEMVRAFEEANDIKIPYEVVKRRKGDLSTSFSDPSKANKELGWRAELDIRDMVRHVWKYETLKT